MRDQALAVVFLVILFFVSAAATGVWISVTILVIDAMT